MASAPAGLSPRWARLLVAAAAAFALGMALVQTVLALADAAIVLEGERSLATVTELGAERRTRQSWTVEAALRAEPASGPAVTAWAERPVPIHGSWSNPPRPPRVGDRVPIFLLQGTEPRLIPVDAVRGRWAYAAILPFAWLIAGGAAWATRRVWRRRVTAAPAASA